MEIKFDEKSVFTYDEKTLSIYIHTHRNERYTGHTFEEGSIKFTDKEQARHFMKMLELMLETKKENATKR